MSRIEAITIEAADRDELERLVRDRNTAQKVVWRARIVLLAGDGLDNVVIAEQASANVNTVSKWRKRFFEERIDGLTDRHRSGRPRTFSPSGCR